MLEVIKTKEEKGEITRKTRVVNTDGVHLIPLQQLMKGVYVLQIKAGNSTQVVKIVKAK